MDKVAWWKSQLTLIPNIDEQPRWLLVFKGVVLGFGIAVATVYFLT